MELWERWPVQVYPAKTFDAFGQQHLVLKFEPLESRLILNLRDLESYMTQDTHLYHDSIKNNLRIANLMQRMTRFIGDKKASIHEYISRCPQGHDYACCRAWRPFHFLAESAALALPAPSCMMRHSCCSTSQPVT